MTAAAVGERYLNLEWNIPSSSGLIVKAVGCKICIQCVNITATSCSFLLPQQLSDVEPTDWVLGVKCQATKQEMTLTQVKYPFQNLVDYSCSKFDSLDRILGM